MIKSTAVAAAIVSIVFTIPSAAQDAASEQDIAAGEAIYQKDCRSCHGPTAKGMASFPKLADKSAEYITNRLEQYRSGETLGPNTPLMMPRAENLTDEDISNIANYISITFN